MVKSLQYGGTAIHYSINGSGTPIVLLHGFAEDHTIWNNQVNALSKVCKIIIPDLPGSGKSGLLPGEGIAIEAYADCMYALLLHEKIERCIMLGHSMGGYITLAFAERYPEMLKGFGFVHSTAFADNEEKKINRIKGIKFIEEHGAFAFIKNTTPNLFSDSFKKEHPEKVEAIMEAGKYFTIAALTQYYTAMLNRPDRQHVLEKSNAKVFFIAGTEDVAAPLDDILQQSHLPRVSYIHIIRNVGHMGMIETPEEVNKHLLHFIAVCEPV